MRTERFFLVSGNVPVNFCTQFILSNHTIKFVHHNLSQELVQKRYWYEKYSCIKSGNHQPSQALSQMHSFIRDLAALMNTLPILAQWRGHDKVCDSLVKQFLTHHTPHGKTMVDPVLTIPAVSSTKQVWYTATSITLKHMAQTGFLNLSLHTSGKFYFGKIRHEINI